MDQELGTAKPYGFNDQIKGVGTLSSTSCKKTNAYTLFNKHQRWKRSHGKRHYNKKAPQPESSIDALIALIDMIDQPEGVHKIKTHLFSMSLPQLSSLQEIALESTNTDFSSAEYRVTSIILDISHYRLFNPVKSNVPAENPKHFMKIKFLHKGIDAINLPPLLRSRSVLDKIPAYFKDKEPPIISYQYTNTVPNKLLNFSSTLSNLGITNDLSNLQHCQCNTSKFCYEPHGHVITGDLMVIENVKLRELVAKGPKYREPNKINWQSTETMVSNSIDLCAEQWFKWEQVDLKYLSEWKDQIKELVVERISSLKEKIRSPKQKILSDLDVQDTLRRLHDDFVLVPADKAANNVIVVCKKYYIEPLIKKIRHQHHQCQSQLYIYSIN